MLACIPAEWWAGELYLGVSNYSIQVRYLANSHEVLAEFHWSKPWCEGDTLPLRYDPANPECNDRTGIWFVRTIVLWLLIGILFLTARILGCSEWS